jgi:hypothetical protein
MWTDTGFGISQHEVVDVGVRVIGGRPVRGSRCDDAVSQRHRLRVNAIELAIRAVNPWPA